MKRFDSIKHRFLLILVICLIGMLMLVLNQMYHTSRLIDLNQDNKVLLRLSADLLQLRRHEKDFMLRKEPVYLELFSAQSETFEKDLEELEPILKTYSLSESLFTDISASFNEYKSMFFEMADLMIKIGLDENSGELGKFRKAAHQLEDYFEKLQIDRWSVMLLQLRRHEKDFMMRKRDEYVVKEQNVHDQLYQEIEKSYVTTKEQQLALLSAYQLGFLNLVESYQMMGLDHETGLQGKFRAQTHQVEDHLNNVDQSLAPLIRDEEDKVKRNGLVIMVLTSVTLIFLIFQSFSTFQKTLTAFLGFFQSSKDRLIQLNPEKVSFSEFKRMAALANEMIEGRSATERKLKEARDDLEELNLSLEERLERGLFEIKKLNDEIESTQREVVFTMGAIGESRSQETGNHVKRVAEYSKLLALKVGMSQDEAELLKQASPMHDIGKVAIPDAILNKPGKLTPEEMEIMRDHARIGHEMLCHSIRPILKTAAIVAGEHHEKWDGTGYPKGLAGENIHIYGRITMLADVFDALGSKRCYKEPWRDEEIYAFLRAQSGAMFDPNLVDLFFEHKDEFLAIRLQYQDPVSLADGLVLNQAS